jgi:hypothetical protein
MARGTSDRVDSYATLHARVVQGDELAAQTIVIELRPFLQRSLHRSFTAAPRDDIVDAVVDALVDYIRRPDRFDPSGAASHRAFPKCSVARGVAACCSGNPVPAAGPRCEGRGGPRDTRVP